MAETVDPEQRRRVIRWLSIGTGVIVLIITLMVILGGIADQRAGEAEKATISESELETAKSFATTFVTSAGTFGISPEAVESNAFSYVKTLVANNKGAYGTSGFGSSRGESYRDSIIPHLDPRGELDTTEYFAKTLNDYYPDWSGQLTSYSVSNPSVTTGDPYLENEITLLPVKVSFTSTLDLYKDESATQGSDSWDHYQSENFETAELLLSLQSDGSWRVWSIADLGDYPYLLNTWAKPDWKAYAPSFSVMQKIE